MDSGMPASVLPIENLIHVWISIGQGLVGAIGGLAFVAAFLWKMLAFEPRSVTEAKRWLGRIVVGTIGVEMAGTLVQVLVGTLPTTH
ncbi:MAG: hypothetical protein ACYDAY_00205 [Candidatus Dormibacteria bacterium]